MPRSAKGLAKRQAWNDANKDKVRDLKRALAVKYNHSDRFKTWRRKWHLQRKYGLSLEAYTAMVESQDGRCAICRKPPRANRPLNVDHCHKSGAIRALLCDPCNSGIAHLQESVEILQRAMDYLFRWQQSAVA